MGLFLKICGAISCLVGIMLMLSLIGLAAGIPTFVGGGILYAIGEIYDRTKSIQESLDSLIKHENIKIKEENIITEAKRIEEENIKTCPECSERIQKDAKTCPRCGYRYRIVHTLTVFKPEDGKQGHLLIKRIMEKMNKPYSEVNDSLKKGMVFEYVNMENLERNRKAFENFGCNVNVDEILTER